ncbi:MAG: dipeptidase [Polyangiaceae bacterium]
MIARWSLLLGFAAAFVGCDRKPDPRLASGSTAAPSQITSVTSAATVAPSASSSSAAPPANLAPEFAPAPPLGAPRAFDMHCDTPYQVWEKGRDPSLPKGHITEKTLRAGNVGGVFLAIYISDKLHADAKKVGHPTIADADAIFDALDRIVAAHPDVLAWAPKGNVPEDKVAAFATIEGAGAFAADITQIDRFIQRGVRFVGLVHMKSDKLASSSTDPDQSYGLTDLGKQFCDRVYQAGALVDVSHMSDKGFTDVVEIAKKFGAPIVATHSNARALANVPRNVTDDELRAIGESGGVIGINFYDKYVKLGSKPTLEDVVAQALYMIKIAGIDHVGIGSDFDGSDPVEDLPDASYFPRFAKALVEAGLSDEDVQKVFSENVKRVLRWRPPSAK